MCNLFKAVLFFLERHNPCGSQLARSAEVSRARALWAPQCRMQDGAVLVGSLSYQLPLIRGDPVRDAAGSGEVLSMLTFKLHSAPLSGKISDNLSAIEVI